MTAAQGIAMITTITPTTRGLEMGRSSSRAQVKTGRTRRRRREAERTSRSPEDGGHPLAHQIHTDDHHGQRGGDVREIAQGGGDYRRQRDPERIEQDAQQGGQVGGGEQDRAPGEVLGPLEEGRSRQTSRGPAV